MLAYDISLPSKQGNEIRSIFIVPQGKVLRIQ